MNIGIEACVSVFLWVCTLRSRITESWWFCLIFRGATTLFSTVAVPLYVPTNNAQGSLTPISIDTCDFSLALAGQTLYLLSHTSSSPFLKHNNIIMHVKKSLKLSFNKRMAQFFFLLKTITLVAWWGIDGRNKKVTANCEGILVSRKGMVVAFAEIQSVL
jgi:hypothetical protein